MLLYHRAQNNWNIDRNTQILVYETREGYIFGCREKKTHSEGAGENKDCLKKKPEGVSHQKLPAAPSVGKKDTDLIPMETIEISVIALVWTDVHLCCPDRTCIRIVYTGFAFFAILLPSSQHSSWSYETAVPLPKLHFSGVSRECSGSDIYLQRLLAAVFRKH